MSLIQNYLMFVILNKILSGLPTIEVDVTSNIQPSIGSSYHLICSHRTSDANFVLSATFQWYFKEILLPDTSSPLLHFSILSLSDAGNYTCEVTATSSLLGILINGTGSHLVRLQGK